MKPADALRLSKARLSRAQHETVNRAIEMLEALYPSHMTRSGMSVDMQCDDPVVLHELECHCKREGWITQIVPDWAPPLVRGAAPTLKGFKMLLAPPLSAYDEVDAEIRS